jgi:hypothetical protein
MNNRLTRALALAELCATGMAAPPAFSAGKMSMKH